MLDGLKMYREVIPMAKGQEDCTVCSGLQADIVTLKESDRDQWTAINALRNRLPLWATGVISLLTFICGGLLTALAVALK